MRADVVLCQSCGTPNSSGREHCSRCGCKLLIVSGAPEPALEAGDEFFWEAQEELEENILERLTSLEEAVRSLSRVVAGSGRGLAQLEHNLTVAHAGVQALAGLLERQGIASRTEVAAGWERAAGRELLSRDLARRFAGCSERILSQARHAGRADAEFRGKLRSLELALLDPESGPVKELLGDLADLAPESDELWSFIGEAAFQTGELDTALMAFRRVIELRGPHCETLVYLGASASDLGRWDEAEAALREARHIAPASFLPHFTLGAMEVLRGRFGEAAAHLERSLDAEETPQSRYLLGVCRLELGQSGRAIGALQRAVELAPDFDDALYDLGVAFLRRGWTVKARRAFEQVLRLEPDSFRYQATVLLLAPEQRPLLPQAVHGLLRRVESALHDGAEAAALALLTSAVEKAPDEPMLHATAALVAATAGRYRRAVSHAREVLRRPAVGSPFAAAAVVALLESLRHAGRRRAAGRVARALYEQQLDPLAHGLAAYELAAIESELAGDLATARDLAREALETTPRELRHHPLTLLGAIAVNLGRYREAVEYLEQASRSARQPQGAGRRRIADISPMASRTRLREPRTGPAALDGGIEREMLDQMRWVAGLLTDLGGRNERAAAREAARWTE